MKIYEGQFGQHVIEMNDAELEFIYRLLGNHVIGSNTNPLRKINYFVWNNIDDYVQSLGETGVDKNCLEFDTQDGLHTVGLL